MRVPIPKEGDTAIEGRSSRRLANQPSHDQRRWPVGAQVLDTGGVHFRVWAPRSATVAIQFEPGASNKPPGVVPLQSEGNGYFSGAISTAAAGMLYKIRLENGAFPDPASRFQPEGPHGPSQIVDPNRFQWGDRRWAGISSASQIIYEMHIGTFTPEGTWTAAAEQLEALAELGVTVLELMPIAEFPGRFGWGYDGVNLFAPTRLYGTPDEFRAFVDRAHAAGLAIILDVVYNHFGPDGNYLKEFSDGYFTDRYKNEWGEAINFDGPGSDPVREFFTANAGYWIEEYHLDGLRFDATQQIFDCSSEHVLTAMTRQVRQSAKGRGTYLVAENEPQHTRLVRSTTRGGYGMDSLWNDDFHHLSMVSLTGRAEAYHSDYRGTPQEFISALKWGYLFQGQRYKWQKQRRGSPALDLEPSRFVNYIQNHDQVANSLRGARAHVLCGPGRLKAITAVLLLGPGSPMLFQGQEFAASTPFFYFADHSPDLAKLVAKGRREFLSQFATIACAAEVELANPDSEETFRRSKLDLSERSKNSQIYALHKDLIALRRRDPVFSQPKRGSMDGAVLSADAFVLRFFGEDAQDRLLLVNLGVDLCFDPAPEPLLAPPLDCSWRVEWSTEDPRYGGCGTPHPETDGTWHIPGHAAIVLAPQSASEATHGEDHAKD